MKLEVNLPEVVTIELADRTFDLRLVDVPADKIVGLVETAAVEAFHKAASDAGASAVKTAIFNLPGGRGKKPGKTPGGKATEVVKTWDELTDADKAEVNATKENVRAALIQKRIDSWAKGDWGADRSGAAAMSPVERVLIGFARKEVAAAEPKAYKAASEKDRVAMCKAFLAAMTPESLAAWSDLAAETVAMEDAMAKRLAALKAKVKM